MPEIDNELKDNSGKVDKPATNIDNKTYNVLLDDAKQIIETSRQQAYSSINVLMVRRNWYLGKRIVEEELHGQNRAEYGAQVLKRLSADLSNYYGKGFDTSNLYKFTQFYKFFPEIFRTISGKSQDKNLDSLSLNSQGLLSWTHYRTLLQVDDKAARDWYAKEAFEQTWSVRTLQRNISTQYYYRLLQLKTTNHHCKKN